MLKKNVVANYLGQSWSALIGLAFIPLYIKYLGIESYGLIGLFAILQTWLVLLDMGMTPTLGREMARFTGGTHTANSIRDLLRSFEIIAASIAILITIGIALSAHWFAASWLRAENLPIDIVSRAFTIMGGVTALRFLEGIYRSSMTGMQHLVTLNIINSTLATIRAIGAVCILMWVSTTIEAFFIWQAVVSLLSLLILALFTYKYLPPGGRSGRFSIDALKGVWSYAAGMFTITFLSLMLTQVDKVILTKLLTLSEYGYYALAAIVAGALYMLVSPISGAWFPRLSQLHAANDDAGMIRTFHQGAQLVSSIAGSAALIIMVYSETLLQLWTQDIELAKRTAPLLSLLVFGNLINSLLWIPYQAQLAHGLTSLGVRVNLIAVLVVVPALVWITPRFGAVGAAWIWVTLNFGYCLIGIHFMYRRILRNEKIQWYIDDVLKPLVSAALAVLVFSWLAPIPVSPIAQVFTLLTASFLTLIAATFSAKILRQQLIFVVTPFIGFENK